MAVERDQVDEVKAMLSACPDGVYFNDKNNEGWTPLHEAVFTCSCAMVQTLLDHPAIDVNAQTRYGSTPLILACMDDERIESVGLLVRHPRVDATISRKGIDTALSVTFDRKSCEVLELLIASEKDLGPDDELRTRALGSTETERLFNKFVANPESTRLEVCLKLGHDLDKLAAELFAVVVFFCDGLLEISRPETMALTTECRFLAIARRLPMELQMILCHRARSSTKDVVLTRDSEPAFRSLAQRLSMGEKK